MQILQRNDVSAQAVAAMGSQFVVENGMVRLEHSQPLVFRPFVHRMPPTQVIGVPDATVLLNEDAMVENVSPRLMPLKVVLQGNGSTQAFGTEVLDANLVAYEDFAGLLGDHRSASGAFSDSSVAASEKRDPFYRTSAAPVDSSSRRVKLMCSFGGRILPRPSDGKLRYVGGETRILSVSRHITYADLLLKLSETYGESLSLKYQLPDEDIESLISVCSDEDLENMMEEFDRLDAGESSSKLRVFLFLAADHDPLHLNDTADRRNSEQKYVDAVNSVGGVCLRNSAEFNSSHDLIGLQLSDVKSSGLPEPETLLTPVTATEVDLQTVAVGMPVPPKLYSGKTLTLSAIPTSSFVAPQPSPVNYQYCTLKTELSHQDLELADSARSSAASHPDLFYHFPGMLEADSLSRMFQSSGIVFSSQEQQKELTTHPGATNTTLGDPSPGMAMPRIDFHQSHLQAPPQTDFIQTSWQHPADEHLSSPTSSVSGNVQKQTLQQEQQTSTVYTPAAHEAMFFKYMDQQQQQEEVLAGPLPSQVAAGPIFQTGSPPSSLRIGLVENINKKFGNMQHMQGYLAFNGGLVDEEHGGILCHNNNQTGRVFHPLNPYMAHVEQAVLTEEQAASQLPVVNIENRQKQIINLAHGKYEPSHVPSKPTVSPYLVLGSYYDGFRHCQDGTIEDQILLEEQQSHSFPNSDSNQDFVLQPDRQPFFCYFNDRQGNMDGAFQHRENDSHEGKLCTGLQSHVKQMDLKENESVANLAFKSYVEFPSEKFPVPNSPEESTSLPDFAATSVGNDPIESTPFYLRTPLYPKGDAEQALVFNPVVVSEGLHAAQLSRRPEMDSLLVHTKPNAVTLALDVLTDSSISIPASNDSTCVPMSQRSFVASNDNSNVFEGQRSSAEKLPDSKLSQLPLQISSLVAGTGLNASESFFSAENETQLTEDFQFNAAEDEVRQQSLLIRGPANDEFSMYKSSLHGNASNRMDRGEGLPLHHSTSTKSLIDDASGVLPYSDHHSSNSVASVSYPELLATLANGFDCSLVNAAIAASHVTSFLPEAVTTHHTLSPSIDLLPVSIHSQPSMNFMVEGAQDQVKEGAKIALKSEFRGLNYTSLDVLKKSENMDPLSSLTSSEEQYNHVKDQSSSFAQLHIHDLENEPKRSSSEHTRESASAAFIQPTLYSAPTLSIQNWEKSLTEAEVEEQDVATDLSQERLSETVKPNAIGEKEVIFEEIKMGMEEEDMHEYKIHQPNNLAAIAEAEAISRGLQIIKNADLEELRELGAGTFGTVYHGKWRGTDVAIKRIKSSCFTGRPSERERLIADFWQEAWILSQLHHPNVVAFYGVVPDGPGGTLATVTEFMVNGSLKQVLQRKDRTIDRRKRLLIAMDAAFGMEYLHGKNIVHFDLKCENLLVNMRDPQRSICKVGDLGLSKIKHQTMVSGGVRGTLPWMAPELLNGSSSLVSEKVDVFSFGIVMWELLTGEEPYANMHYGAIIGGIVNNTLRPSVPNWCDPAWKSLMECCWSSEPNERPSFPDIARALRAMAASLHARGQTQTQGKTSPGANAGM